MDFELISCIIIMLLLEFAVSSTLLLSASACYGLLIGTSVKWREHSWPFWVLKKLVVPILPGLIWHRLRCMQLTCDSSSVQVVWLEIYLFDCYFHLQVLVFGINCSIPLNPKERKARLYRIVSSCEMSQYFKVGVV